MCSIFKKRNQNTRLLALSITLNRENLEKQAATFIAQMYVHSVHVVVKDVAIESFVVVTFVVAANNRCKLNQSYFLLS